MSAVPTRRLLVLVLGAAILAAIAGPLPMLLPVWLLALGAVFLAALGDLAASFAGDGPPEVSAPNVTRFTKDRAGRIDLAIANPGSRARNLRLGLGLPAAFASRDEEIWVSIPAQAARSTVGWPCTPSRRGRFPVGVACVEMGSPFGLWRLRARRALAGEMRVYPNLFSGSRQLSALMLARGRNGIRVRRMVGRGREFEKLREYLPGDSFDEIHWKATAKRGRPVTKVFQVERTQELYVVIDHSRLSGRMVVTDEGEQPALESYLTAALVLMIAAEKQGDKFGLVAHDDLVRVFLRAGHSQAHYAACREAVLGLEPTEHTPDMAEIVRHLCTHLLRRSLLFFLTDLTDPLLAEDFVRNVRVLSRRHMVFVCQMRPPEVASLFDGEPVSSEREIYSRLASHVRWSELRDLSSKLRPLGVTSSLMGPRTLATQLVSQYLQVKRRQVL